MPKPSRSDQPAARRARVEELQRAQRGKERRRLLLIIGAILLVVIVVVVVVVLFVRSGSPSSSPTPPSPKLDVSSQIIPAPVTGATTVQQTPKRVPDNSGIPGVLAWDTKGYPGNGQSYPGALQHEHVNGPVTYAVSPPVGGPHNPIWMNAGIYTKPVPDERAVHDMEHGAIWIVYDPDLPANQVAQLQAFVTKQSLIPESPQASGVADQANRYVVLSPWAANTLPRPIVLSAWGHQLRVADPGDPRLQRFIDTFRHNSTYSPEFGAAVDGVPVQTGGRPAGAGSRQPNPAGSAQ